MKNLVKLLAIVGCVAFTAVTASANSITLTDVSQVGGDFTYTVSGTNSTLNFGDFWTINDFGPATLGANTLPAGWVFSQALTGPNSLPATDNPGVLNATFTWNGANGTPFAGPFSFLLHGTAGPTTLNNYTSLDHVASGPSAGQQSKVFGSVTTPAIPDGGSAVALLGIALAGIEGMRRVIAGRKAKG